MLLVCTWAQDERPADLLLVQDMSAIHTLPPPGDLITKPSHYHSTGMITKISLRDMTQMTSTNTHTSSNQYHPYQLLCHSY
jgi:hypothetical protein